MRVREYTNRMMQLIDEGCIFDTKDLVEQLLCWLSEDDVKEFYYANGFGDFDEDRYDED